MCVCVCFLTLLASQKPLDALDELVSVTVSVDANLFQLLVTHVCQHIQRNLPGNDKQVSQSCLWFIIIMGNKYSTYICIFFTSVNYMKRCYAVIFRTNSLMVTAVNSEFKDLRHIAETIGLTNIHERTTEAA